MQTTNTLDRYAPYALAALRIVSALIFMEHGTQKLFGFPAPPQSGLPPALSLLWWGAILEFGGGLLILAACSPVRSPSSSRARWRWHTGCSTHPGTCIPC